MSMYVGEALAGDGNEIAHIDLLVGSKDGPVGVAFANALARQSSGHNNLLAVLTPNLAVKPATVMVTKVTIEGMSQALQMFGPAQAAVAKAVADSVADGVIPADQAEDLVIVCGVFIAPGAEDNAKIYSYNYEATKDAMLDELSYFCSVVFRGVTTEEAMQDTDGKIVGCRWVNCNKGDLEDPDVRCRLVAQEVNHGDSPNDAFYAATPPLEAERLLFSQWATEQKRGGKFCLSAFHRRQGL